MSIWKGTKLVPHSYEKTIVAARNDLLVWIDGTNVKLSFINPAPFGICGGSINTNSGISLNKKQLIEIANSLKEGATLKICAGHIYLTKESLKYSQAERTVYEDFERDNDYVQISDNSFARSAVVLDMVNKKSKDIAKGYRASCIKNLKERGLL